MLSGVQDLEQKVWDLVMTQEHLLALIGVFSVLIILQYMGPVKKFLFSDKWKWLIAPVNVALSFFAIFVLNLTTMNTIGMKVIMACALSAVSTLSYEAVFKYVISYFNKKIEAKAASIQ